MLISLGCVYEVPKWYLSTIGLLNQRLFGVPVRSWLWIVAVAIIVLATYEGRRPIQPNALEQPGAEVPNRLRSPCVQNPI
jgi:hypothetical protein